MRSPDSRCINWPDVHFNVGGGYCFFVLHPFVYAYTFVVLFHPYGFRSVLKTYLM